MQFITNKPCIGYRKLDKKIDSSTYHHNIYHKSDKSVLFSRGDINRSHKIAFTLSTRVSLGGSKWPYDILMRIPLWFQLLLLYFRQYSSNGNNNGEQEKNFGGTKPTCSNNHGNLNKLMWNKIVDLSVLRHVVLVLHQSFKEVLHYLRIKAVIVIRKSN